MCVPLKTSEDRPLGALQLDTQDRAKKFRDDDLSMLTIVANLASVAIEKSKLHETLLSREEAVKAVDLGDYYRVPADTRDLNYGIYFEEGNAKISRTEEYNSHNTKRLSREELKKLLLNLDYIQEQLKI